MKDIKMCLETSGVAPLALLWRNFGYPDTPSKHQLAWKKIHEAWNTALDIFQNSNFKGAIS